MCTFMTVPYLFGENQQLSILEPAWQNWQNGVMRQRRVGTSFKEKDSVFCPLISDA